MYRPGNVVAGKYRIEHVLGQGGMGYVVAATHLDLGTPVALKFLHEHMLENQGVVDRFKREARASAQLRGENVCRVSDVGTTEEGQPFFVMELLSGQDLTAVLAERGTLSVALAAEILLQACLALAEAHAAGIVHRDIKPGNLMLTSRPDGTMCIKVLDFGVAKAPEDTNFSLTQTSSVIGSPGYMSPEQLKSSKGADVRSDIWSLGVVMYELVAGQKPWAAESMTELTLKVALEAPAPLAGRVPWEFEGVVMHCLEKDPTKRYQDVADLAVALAPYAGSRGPEMARAVARVLRGAHTPMPVLLPAAEAMQAPAPVHASSSAAAIPPTSSPTTLRGSSGVVAQSHSQVTTKKSWKLPVIMGGGALVGVALALVILGGHKKKTTTPSAAPSEIQMQSPSTGTPTAKAGDEAPDKGAADKLAADKAKATADKQAAKDAADKLAADRATAKADAADKLAAEKAAKADAAKQVAADKAEKAKEAAAEKAAAKEAAAQKAAADKAAAKQAAAEKAAAEKAAAKQAAAEKAAAKTSADKATTQTAKTNTTKSSSTKSTSSKTTSTKTTSTKTTTPKDIGDSRQ